MRVSFPLPVRKTKFEQKALSGRGRKGNKHRLEGKHTTRGGTDVDGLGIKQTAEPHPPVPKQQPSISNYVRPKRILETKHSKSSGGNPASYSQLSS